MESPLCTPEKMKSTPFHSSELPEHDENLNCPICHQIFQQPVRTQCG